MEYHAIIMIEVWRQGKVLSVGPLRGKEGSPHLIGALIEDLCPPQGGGILKG